MKQKVLLILLIYIGLCRPHAYAQYRGEVYPDSVDQQKLNKVILTEVGLYVSGLAFLSTVWYKDVERVPFQWYNDNAGYLQIDKFGHAYSAYRQSYSSYFALRKTGLSEKKSLIYGGLAGLAFQTPIEIFDGIHERWGFSWGDMAENAFGSALFMAQQAAWQKQYVTMKFSYAPSPYPELHSNLGDSHLERFFLDYNGHTYWFSGNIAGMTRQKKIPSWLNLAIGYSGNGMIKEFENPTFYRGETFPHIERYRQFLVSLDVDFTEIHTNKKGIKALFRVMNLIKIPFPALEINRIDGLKLRPFYF